MSAESSSDGWSQAGTSVASREGHRPSHRTLADAPKWWRVTFSIARRFAALWELPEEMLLLRADDEVFEWLRGRVESPVEYERRLAEIDRDPTLRATDTLRLRSGALLERTTLPQLARGRPIGRVFSYRIAAAGAC